MHKLGSEETEEKLSHFSAETEVGMLEWFRSWCNGLIFCKICFLRNICCICKGGVYILLFAGASERFVIPQRQPLRDCAVLNFCLHFSTLIFIGDVAPDFHLHNMETAPQGGRQVLLSKQDSYEVPSMAPGVVHATRLLAVGGKQDKQYAFVFKVNMLLSLLRSRFFYFF